jgi:hypothetical protein
MSVRDIVDTYTPFNRERFNRYAMLIAINLRDRLDNVIEALDEDEPKAKAKTRPRAKSKAKARR